MEQARSLSLVITRWRFARSINRRPFPIPTKSCLLPGPIISMLAGRLFSWIRSWFVTIRKNQKIRLTVLNVLLLNCHFRKPPRILLNSAVTNTISVHFLFPRIFILRHTVMTESEECTMAEIRIQPERQVYTIGTDSAIWN